MAIESLIAKFFLVLSILTCTFRTSRPFKFLRNTTHSMYIYIASRRESYIIASDERRDNLHKYFVMWLPSTSKKS